MRRYKVPVTLTISFNVSLDADSPEGALTNVKTMLDFNGDEFAETDGLLFDEDEAVEIDNAAQVGEPSFGAVEEAPDGTDDEGDAEEDQTPETGGEATPPKATDLK